ncbi:MAG TPA: O-antigen ligase family protein [Vicinamibacteria bacterium]
MSARERASLGLLAAVLLLLPFEQRAALVHAFGLNFTLLEVTTAAATVGLLALWPGRLRERPAPPLLALLALALANLVAAAAADQHRAAAAVFALRLVAALFFALAVSVAPARVQQRSLEALAVAGSVAAALAVGEALGLRALDPWLDLFRERAFGLAGGARRATAGAAGPNVGAAFIAAGLLAGVARLAERDGAVARSLLLGAALGAGLLSTYSRGGLAAAAAGLAGLAWTHGPRSPGRRAAGAALAALLGLAGLWLALPAFRGRLAAEWPPRALSARCELVDAPPALPPGETTRVRVRVTNDGTVDWPEDATYRLAVGWYDPASGSAERWASFPFGRGLGAGASVVVPADLHAPERAGPYVLALDVNSAATGYFSTAGTTPGWVPVVVGTGAGSEGPRAVPPPPAARGRFELWRIALVMWRAHPLTGVGPDNFRRLHVAYGGWIAPGNTPVGAHNVFLEAAATTGLIGLLALIAVFAASFAGAARAGARGALALLAAIVVQGLVDSLLGFTGVYLLLAYAVGLSSSRSQASAASS